VTSLRFAVIGAGRLGASLALALRAKGLPLVAYSAYTPAGRTRAEAWLGGSAMADLPGVVSTGPDLYLLTVPDAVLPVVAWELGELLSVRPGALVAHTSGATSVEVLEPCERQKATTFAFHPLQTFSEPLAGHQRFPGIAVAVTPGARGHDPRAAEVGFALAYLLGARPFLLADDKRALYHTAAAMACNYLVTLEHEARGLFVQSGLPSDEALGLFLPLVRATLDNLEAQGTVNALTGPLSRADVQTVRTHLDALARYAPSLLPLYQTLGLATLDLVEARREIDTATIDELAGLLGRSQGYDEINA
jgi:predicted short-subunit dehydrogenase-like oxidoreductase (DUF2520 family)